LSKTVSKFVKDNGDIYTFKAGIVEGKVVSLKQVEAIASLPSKEELISKLMFVINAQAQRIVTVINAVPRNLAVVVKLIGELPAEQKGGAKAAEPKQEETAPVVEASSEAQPTLETVAEASQEVTEQVSEPATETAQESEQILETGGEAVAETTQEGAAQNSDDDIELEVPQG
jgi:large subunit ribosomal protein L10